MIPGRQSSKMDGCDLLFLETTGVSGCARGRFEEQVSVPEMRGGWR